MGTDRKINVLDLRSCRGGGGGPEKTILFSALETDKSCFNMHIAYLKSHDDPEFDLDKRAHSLGVPSFHIIDERSKFDFRALRRLLALLREKQIDILHTHCYKSDLYGLLLKRRHKMKLVTTAHGPLATLKHFWRSKNWRVRYVYDRIDLRILRYFDLVLMVSDTMRAAAQLLLQKRPELHFVIAGKGELERELRHMAQDLGIASRVTCMGHFHDVRKVFELMDVYVLSSTREGLPNTVLEAMSLEVPIVSTDVDGVREAVTGEREAVLVP